MAELDSLYSRVSATTTEVRHECQVLLKQQKSVLDAANHLHAHLSYFDEAERIATHLKVGLRAAQDLSDSAVVSEEFSQLLNKIERSMAFLTENVSLCCCSRNDCSFICLVSLLFCFATERVIDSGVSVMCCV
jgi:hypothetical protein